MLFSLQPLAKVILFNFLQPKKASNGILVAEAGIEIDPDDDTIPQFSAWANTTLMLHISSNSAIRTALKEDISIAT